MDSNQRKVTFELDNVVVSIAGPLKDEAPFVGKLMIVEEPHGPDIEWKPTKLKSSDTQSSSPELETLEWEDVSSSVGYRANHNDSIDAVEIKAVRMPKDIKFDICDLKSFKKTEISEGHTTVLTFLLKDGTNVPSFQFESCDFGRLCAALDGYIHFKRSKKENNLYLMVDPKVEALEKSFSELDLFSDSKSHIITKLMHDPVNTAMGGFSKVTNFLVDYLVYPNESQESFSVCPDDQITEIISGNILNVDIDHHEEPGYELITRIELPPRPVMEREEPVTLEEWSSFFDSDGKVVDIDELKRRVFKGGLSHAVRPEAWKYLLNFYDLESMNKNRALVKKKKTEDYFRMKLQWKSFDADQESRFSALRERKSLIEKDVSRTDRTHPFFEGENNPNIQMLQDILTTYCMYNFDLGYVQGMSDLLSPILVVMQNEIDAFWCFAGWLQNIGVNFELEQQGMKNQLQDLHRLLHFVDSQLCSYLERHESGNMYFAFRWLLILFKRDFKFADIMRLWEVLWTGLPCKNFHLLICIAILDTEKMTIMENEYGLTEILKHVNEMSYKIDLDKTLCKAEAIYHQIKNSRYRSDVVENILGLEHIPQVTAPTESPQQSPVKQGSGSKRTASFKKKRPLGVSADSDEFVDLENNYHWQFDPFS